MTASAQVEPVRLDIVDPSKILGVCRSAIRHVAACHSVTCFAESNGIRMMAFRIIHEPVGTRVISSAAGCSGTFTRVAQLEDVVARAAKHAFANLAEDERRPIKGHR